MSDGPLDPMTAPALVDTLRGHPVVIVGDVMLDRYWWGHVSRLSPEAPVPVVEKQRSSVAPGGAANVAANVTSLGGLSLLIGVVGADEAGRELAAELRRRAISPEHLVTDPRRPTTMKTRIVAVSQHVVRVDEEDRSPVAPSTAARLAERVLALLDGAQVLVISDYAKGMLSADVLQRIIRAARARNARVVVDPKGHDYSRYAGASLICPNRGEALGAAQVSADDVEAVPRAGRRLLESGVADALLITLGEAGMMLFEPDRPPTAVPALARAVYDVTGAGDTVIATMSLAVAAGIPLERAVRLANVAAGLAVEQVGTTAVTAAQLREALSGGRAIPEAPVTPTG